jgi:mono/diheme cytochrome c family protein
VKPEPGRDPEMARRTERLNLLFAATSIALLLALSAMIWADYDRSWKPYQLEFNKLEVRLTEQQVQEALGKVGADRRKALEAELAKGDQEIAAHRGEVNKAQAEASKVHNEWYAVDQNYRFTKADIDVKRYEYEEAAHARAASAAAKKASLQALESKLADLRARLDDVKAREAAANAKVADLEKTRLQAEKTQKELYFERDRLNEKLRKIQPGLVSFVRNLPILDLANPSLKINQILPANLNDDVIFSQTPKVDRCTTCHLGIDKKGYENERQPFKAHPDIETYLRGPHPIEKIGCTACHQGRGRATSFVNAVHTPSTMEQEKAWGRYSHTSDYERWHQWDQPMLAKGYTESQCAKCHQGMVDVPKADKLNAGIFLVQKYGCFGCHKIKGWEGLRKVGPDLSKVATKTDEEWMFRWVKEPRAFRPTRMPQIWDVRTPDQDTAERKARSNTEVNAVVAYLVDTSARVPYPDPPAGDLAAGRRLFESVGCMACHRIGDDRRGVDGIPAASFRTHGPNLDGTGSKVNAGWLYAWVRNPKGYWHDTRMPNLRLTDKEAADVTAYLMSLKNEAFTSRERPSLDPTIRDDILLREYLYIQYSVADAQKKLESLDDRQRTLYLGERVIARQGCFGCHEIPGFEKTAPVGTELTEEGSKLVERLDFGYLEHEIPHTLPAWVRQKLLEPRIFDRDKPAKRPEELLRMPKFFFTEEEADAIVTAVLSLTKEQIPLAAQKQLSADERYVEQGRRLVRDYNCQGCHVVGARGGAVRGIIEGELVDQGMDPVDARLRAAALSPPTLYNEAARIGEGARVQTAWLHGFLGDPSRRIRPWLKVRMPTFGFSDVQLNTITRFFATLDRVPYPYEPAPQVEAAAVSTGKVLFEKWRCVSCHVVAGKLPSQEDPALMAPDLAEVPRRLRADWIGQWLQDPGWIQPGTRMPANFPASAQENAYPEILGGDQTKQIDVVRAYLLTLGKGIPAARQADP